MRYILTVSYDGTNYCGWQVQPNGVTVQQVLNAAVFQAFGETATVKASGRTDAGVHARAQLCQVDLNTVIEGDKLADALNARLPDDISVLSSACVPDTVDIQEIGKGKTYRYYMYFCRRKKPLFERYAAWIKGEPNLEKMREAAEILKGEHDFKAYCASGSQVKTTVRNLYEINVFEIPAPPDAQIVCIEAYGNGFLYNMVRTLAGTLLWYSQGKLTKEDLYSTLQGDRGKVGKTMPAKGLVLYSAGCGLKPENDGR
ncbi:MAG: tRNA pseudouridine(38-40) synthase TruA [Roseburia sp.]|nr:tRNA pseudouridine(38-40) synthase TruA [Roseburia sp.]